MEDSKTFVFSLKFPWGRAVFLRNLQPVLPRAFQTFFQPWPTPMDAPP